MKSSRNMIISIDFNEEETIILREMLASVLVDRDNSLSDKEIAFIDDLDEILTEEE